MVTRHQRVSAALAGFGPFRNRCPHALPPAPIQIEGFPFLSGIRTALATWQEGWQATVAMVQLNLPLVALILLRNLKGADNRTLELTRDSSPHCIAKRKAKRSESEEQPDMKVFLETFPYGFAQSAGQVIRSVSELLLKGAKEHFVRLYIRVTQDTQECRWPPRRRCAGVPGRAR